MPQANADAVLHTIHDRKQYEQYKAELSYMRGDFSAVKQYFETVSPIDATYFCGADIAAAAAMSTGDYDMFKRINQEVEQTEKAAGTENVHYAAEIFRGIIATSMNAPEMAPDWLKAADFDDFPSDSRTTLIFLRVKYLQGIQDWHGMLAAAQTASLMLAKRDELTTTDIYLTCLCGCASYAMGRTDDARAYLDKAVAMSANAGITTPLGEYAACVGRNAGNRLEKSSRRV